MAELVGFSIGGGEARVFVDVADDEEGVRRVSRGGGVIGSAVAPFEEGFGRVREAAAHAIERLTALPRPPSTVELEFGVRLSAQAGAVFARTGADGHLKVRMVWESRAGENAGDAEGGDDSGDDGDDSEDDGDSGG